MKRLFTLLALVTVAALAWGCAASAGPFRLGKEAAPPGIDQAVVTALVCDGKPTSDVHVYVVERGGSDADFTERLERAKATIADGRLKGDPKYASCCQGDQCPASH
jgi:hypothetical protein